MKIVVINTLSLSVVAEQCLYRDKDLLLFFSYYAVLTVRRMGVHKKLGEDTTKTADLD